MKKTIAIILSLAAAAAICLTGCDKSETTQKTAKKEKIRIGTIAVVADEVEAARADIEKAGYEYEVVVFDDPIIPNTALVEGSIDVSFYQHKPYLDNYNKKKETDLVMTEAFVHAPMFGLYSIKISSLEELKDGALVSIAMDSSNQGRGLLLLQSAGLISLKEGVAIPNKFDITDNPKNLRFVELEVTNLVQSLADSDLIAVAGALMVKADRDANSYLAISNDLKTYGVAPVVARKDLDAPWLSVVEKAFLTPRMKEFIMSEYKGAFVPIF